MQTALIQMDDSKLTLEQLDIMSNAFPDNTECKDLQMYKQGKHPKYKVRRVCFFCVWHQGDEYLQEVAAPDAAAILVDP